MRCNESRRCESRIMTLKLSANLNGKSGGDNSMLIKGNEIITRIIKRFPEVNDIGIKLDCLKVKSMLAPSSQIPYRVIGY